MKPAYESSSLVGRVHLGIAFLHDAARIQGLPGAEPVSLRWVSRREIGTDSWPFDRFETWSQLGLKLLQESPWA